MRRRDEWAGAATATAAGLLALIGLCLALPRAPVITALGQLAPYMALALLLPGLVLLSLRRWWRAAACLLLCLAVLGHTWWLFQGVAAQRAAPATGGTEFKLVSFNALYDNRDGVSAVPFLLESGADAILILEAFQFQAELPRLMERYPYRLGCSGREPCDTLLLSRHRPLSSAQSTLGAVQARRYVEFAFDIGGRRVTLVGAHMSKPYFDELPVTELWTLSDRLVAMKGPTILAGDFNSAPWSPILRQLAVNTGLRFSGFYVPTWPASAGAFGLPIDHVLTRGADVLSLEPMPSAFGSNHRGLVARIRIP